MRPRVVIIVAPAPVNIPRELENMQLANMDVQQPGTPPITTAKTSMADTAFLRLASVEASGANTSSTSDIR
jgi:hypothetical protein